MADSFESDCELCCLSLDQAEDLAGLARIAGIFTLIGGIVAREDGCLFTQRRSLIRKFGPGLWDNVGGHVEGQETLRDTLAREMREETGWTLKDILHVIAIRKWDDPGHGISYEYIVLCSALGDLNHPVLEPGKVDRYEWVGPGTLDLLMENRGNDCSQLNIYHHALSLLNV